MPVVRNAVAADIHLPEIRFADPPIESGTFLRGTRAGQACDPAIDRSEERPIAGVVTELGEKRCFGRHLADMEVPPAAVSRKRYFGENLEYPVVDPTQPDTQSRLALQRAGLECPVTVQDAVFPGQQAGWDIGKRQQASGVCTEANPDGWRRLRRRAAAFSGGSPAFCPAGGGGGGSRRMVRPVSGFPDRFRQGWSVTRQATQQFVLAQP